MAARQSGLFLGLSVNALLRAMGWVPTAELTEAESASRSFDSSAPSTSEISS
jgi:hypothetical protein